MIRGISDVRRLPRLGKIRLGEKRKAQSGASYPSALDHFSFTDVPFLEQLYGKNCRELDVMLPNEYLDVFFPQALKAYRKSGLFCRCDDGETATRVRVGLSDGTGKVPKGQELDPQGEARIKETGETVEIGGMFELPCPGRECPFTKNDMCKPIGRLLFLLPKAPQFGVFEIATTSFNSIVTLNSYIDAVRNVAGRVSMIPLKLRLVPKQVQVEGKGKTIHHLTLTFEGTVQQLLTYSQAKLPRPLPKAALPSREELDREMPDDLVPGAGAVLERHLGGQAPFTAPSQADASWARQATASPKPVIAPAEAARLALGAPAPAPNPETGDAQKPVEIEDPPPMPQLTPPMPRLTPTNKEEQPQVVPSFPAKEAAPPPAKPKTGRLF